MVDADRSGRVPLRRMLPGRSLIAAARILGGGITLVRVSWLEPLGIILIAAANGRTGVVARPRPAHRMHRHLDRLLGFGMRLHHRRTPERGFVSPAAMTAGSCCSSRRRRLTVAAASRGHRGWTRIGARVIALGLPGAGRSRAGQIRTSMTSTETVIVLSLASV
ncbi:hypothetical protein [Nocardia sp. NPDC057455]|uniref:hypothetical protein n=1 Tax=Nocardia sp. NPDC057455 TaxID=3346138 RepID=UPI00366E5628